MGAQQHPQTRCDLARHLAQRTRAGMVPMGHKIYTRLVRIED